MFVACGGKVVVDHGGADAGGAGTTSSGTTSTSTTSSGTTWTSTTASDSTSSGWGGATACRSCAEYFTDANEQGTVEPTGDPLCAEPSEKLWDVMLGCACAQCLAECPAVACPAGTGTDAPTCGICLGSQLTGMCSAEAGACANDA